MDRETESRGVRLGRTSLHVKEVAVAGNERSEPVRQ
jgi:hypothetical protein